MAEGEYGGDWSFIFYIDDNVITIATDFPPLGDNNSGGAGPPGCLPARLILSFNGATASFVYTGNENERAFINKSRENRLLYHEILNNMDDESLERFGNFLDAVRQDVPLELWELVSYVYNLLSDGYNTSVTGILKCHLSACKECCKDNCTKIKDGDDSGDSGGSDGNTLNADSDPVDGKNECEKSECYKTKNEDCIKKGLASYKNLPAGCYDPYHDCYN